jgi:PPK2 family polyphosphate:nucleotide phosphotransferase
MDLEPIAPGAHVRLTDRMARPPQGVPAGEELEAATARTLHKVGDLQQRLYSDGRHGVLVVLQGRDASGKDGVIRKVFGACSPLGLHIAAFAAPTTVERSHDFLWRVHQQVPARRYLGVFNRSHYEDVLVARVRELVPRKVWKARYEQINAFEATLAAAGITVLKFFLHISREEQGRRLLERLDDPTKRWKFDPGDLDDRDRWDDYTDAYQDALSRCSTPDAPWYVVPADDKKVRDYLIGRTLKRALKGLDLQYPEAEFDVAACRARLLAGPHAPVPADDADDAPPA